MRGERIVAATGAMYVIAIMVGNGLATGTSSNVQSGQQILADLQRGRTPAEAVGVVMEILGFGLLLLFLGYLYRVLRRAERPEGWAAAAAFGTGLVATAIKLGSGASIVAEVLRAHELTPDLARTLDDLGGGAFVISGYAYGVFVAIAAGAAIRSRVLPRWLSVAGLVVGVLTVVAATAGVLDPAGYVPVPFLLCLAWLLITSVMWTLRPPRTHAPVDRMAEAVPAEASARA